MSADMSAPTPDDAMVDQEAPPPKRVKIVVPLPAEVIDGPPQVLPAPPEPKRMGRPTGAKDAQKRKTPVRAKRAIVVVERPIAVPEAAAPSESYAPSPPSPPPPPPSPRALMREAQSLILQAHHGRSESRRSHFQESVLRCTSAFQL